MDLYTDYEGWKGWTKPFTATPDERAYFEGETRDVKIRAADVLEIGFGSGSFLAWARERGARIAGSEINETLLTAAREEGIELLPAAIETVADAHAGRFDTIAAFDVFEHFSLDEITRRLDACARMLKPGGHLLLRFPNGQSPFGLVPQHGDPTHKSCLSRSIFEQLTRGSALEITDYRGAFGIGGGGLAQRLARSLRRLARAVISAMLNAVYATNIPYDAVVVLVFRRRADGSPERSTQ